MQQTYMPDIHAALAVLATAGMQLCHSTAVRVTWQHQKTTKQQNKCPDCRCCRNTTAWLQHGSRLQACRPPNQHSILLSTQQRPLRGSSWVPTPLVPPCEGGGSATRILSTRLLLQPHRTTNVPNMARSDQPQLGEWLLLQPAMYRPRLLRQRMLVPMPTQSSHQGHNPADPPAAPAAPARGNL